MPLLDRGMVPRCYIIKFRSSSHNSIIRCGARVHYRSEIILGGLASLRKEGDSVTIEDLTIPYFSIEVTVISGLFD